MSSAPEPHCQLHTPPSAMKSLLPNSRKHDISFHPNGKIDISAHIARKLSLVPGDVIDIAQSNGECYLYVKLRAGNYSGRHVGRVWATAHGKGTFRTWSKAIAMAVLHQARAVAPLRCPCGLEIEHDNRKYITIIYRCALSK